ncbi:MAG: alpha/beta hydrolase [Planctomycetota bacterium]|nr:alpha/beta hydrolase [Planctomycetota bacterium]MDA1249368.1 alpha/beta hydrolase [Planctomycetota bacterium]
MTTAFVLRRLAVIAAATVLLALLPPDQTRGAEPERLDRLNLLQFRSAEGVQPVKSPADWEKRRAEIVAGMETVMGPFPGADRRVDLDVKVEEEADAGSSIRRLITYQSEPKSRTPAYLCIPKDVLAGKRKAAAVLCLHPTDNTVGHKVVVGLGGRAGRQYASELTERGYVTLSPAYTHLANYWPNLGELGHVSGTMKAIWDNSRGMDLLESLEFVDASHGFGAIGHSLGGHNAIYTAVFDKRVSVIVSSCGFDSYLDYYDGAERVWFFGAGWCQIRYMPRLSNYRGKLETIPYDFPELLGALAPRPLFVNAPLHDSNFRWKSVDVCAKAARPVYGLLGDENDLVIRHPDSDHNFPDEMRKEAYETIDRALRPQK